MTWHERLISAIGKEYGDRGAVAVLATVSPSGTPAGRCVILRRVESDGRLIFTADLRSEKIEHLRHQPAAEAVLWLPSLRQQFRVAGDVKIVTGHAAITEWTALPELTRQTFFGPVPGEPFSSDWPTDVDLSSPPSSFAKLELTPTRVESLDLNETPHLRLRWSAAGDWREQRINP